jgi:asparaginyl-tRNA synthetase
MTMNVSPDSALFAPKSWADTDSHFLVAMDAPWYRLVFDLLDTINTATMTFMKGRGLKSALLPITTGSISSPMGLGSDSVPVKIDLFGIPTYLADSMQFMLEYGCRFADAGCYYLMPSFRGEASDERHLAQFFHAEAEIPGGMDEVISFVEDYVRALAQAVLDEHGERLAAAFDVTHIEKVAQGGGAFPRVTLDQALTELADVADAVRYDQDSFRVLTPVGERALMERHGGIVWVTHLDHLSVPFYQAYDDADGTAARCADLLMGIGETVGSGERHAKVEELQRALAHHQVDGAPYNWYAEMRRSHPMQTAGFGLGTERFLCWLLGHDDVRDFQLVPRVNGVQIVP